MVPQIQRWSGVNDHHFQHLTNWFAFSMSSTARVGPSVPRQDRPVREGTRVASIETGLAAAAAKLSQQVRRVTFPTRVSLHCVKLGLPPDTSTTARLCRLPGLGTGRQESGSRFQGGTGEPGTQPHAPYPRQALLTNSMIALGARMPSLSTSGDSSHPKGPGT